MIGSACRFTLRLHLSLCQINFVFALLGFLLTFCPRVPALLILRHKLLSNARKSHQQQRVSQVRGALFCFYVWLPTRDAS